MTGTKHDVVDTADNSPRQAANVAGKRVKAIPFYNGTTVVVRDTDFQQNGVTHPDVTWDFRVDDFTVAVGQGITQEAANLLVTKFPESFEYVGE